MDDVHSGLSLVAIAHKLEATDVPVPRDRHAQLQGRPMGGRRHGRDFERFRWTAGSLSKILRTPALMGHRVHRGQTVRDAAGSPVLIGPPLLTEEEFQALQDILRARSNGAHPKRRETSLLIGVAHCTGCSGRMYSPHERRTHTATTPAALLPVARPALPPPPSAPTGWTTTPSAATTRHSP
ncbi:MULTISPECIES: recombinase family protein [unclassified Streptomyces]|uniref:recombinase family protein n=1 Tax=unclassified Streptomyces TaxID=2593676 RepID=UPI003649260F